MDVEISQTQETCIKCNVVFWITSEHHQQLVQCKNTFYCPNGHAQFYRGESDASKIERLKYELRQEKKSSERIARSNAALRGVITRKKNQQA